MNDVCKRHLHFHAYNVKEIANGKIDLFRTSCEKIV